MIRAWTQENFTTDEMGGQWRKVPTKGDWVTRRLFHASLFFPSVLCYRVGWYEWYWAAQQLAFLGFPHHCPSHPPVAISVLPCKTNLTKISVVSDSLCDSVLLPNSKVFWGAAFLGVVMEYPRPLWKSYGKLRGFINSALTSPCINSAPSTDGWKFNSLEVTMNNLRLINKWKYWH